MDGLGYRRLAAFFAEYLLIDPSVLFILKVSFGNQKAFGGISVQLAGEPEAIVTVLQKNVSPFAGFQRNTIGSCKTCGNKSDILIHVDRTGR